MATQNAQMAHKVEVVDEVKTRMGAATASIVSEYRGLTVAELAALRHALAAVGGDYKIFKNTLVRRAIDGGEYQPLEEYLSGPSALTFVQGDISAVAKALRDFSRANPHLVIKGGLADGSLLSTSDLAALADLPPRDVLLARLAGALAAPMTQMAGLLKALPQNLAYGISALIDQMGGVEEPPATAPAETAEAEAAAPESPDSAEAVAPEATEATEVAEATEAPDATEATEATEVTDAGESESEPAETAETASDSAEAAAGQEAEAETEAATEAPAAE